MDTNKTDWQIKIFSGISYLAIGAGLYVFLEHIVLKFHLKALSKLALTGDYLGGVAGSLWAFAGVLLFYVALIIQRQEFQLQRKELENHRVEIRINRILNIIFKQIDKIDKGIDYTVFNISGAIKGIEGLHFFSNRIELSKAGKLPINELSNFVTQNINSAISMVDLLISPLNSLKKIIDSSSELSVFDKEELKNIFLDDIENVLSILFNFNEISEKNKDAIIQNLSPSSRERMSAEIKKVQENIQKLQQLQKEFKMVH